MTHHIRAGHDPVFAVPGCNNSRKRAGHLTALVGAHIRPLHGVEHQSHTTPNRQLRRAGVMDHARCPRLDAGDYTWCWRCINIPRAWCYLAVAGSAPKARCSGRPGMVDKHLTDLAVGVHGDERVGGRVGRIGVQACGQRPALGPGPGGVVDLKGCPQGRSLNRVFPTSPAWTRSHNTVLVGVTTRKRTSPAAAHYRPAARCWARRFPPAWLTHCRRQDRRSHQHK